jgi:hypothetical protein
MCSGPPRYYNLNNRQAGCALNHSPSKSGPAFLLPMAAVLGRLDRAYAELRLYGVLGSSSSKDMEMGAEVQNEKATTSRRVCSLGLLRDWHREAKVRDEGPGFGLERPGASSSLSSLSY